MRILRTIAVAFGMYSLIPMPHFNWTSEDMRYQLSAFPLVGGIIGAAVVLSFELLQRVEAGMLFQTLLLASLPLLITGGFHMDGFMDTEDALCSYQSREKKLAILKDPHVGSFAVIRAIQWTCFYVAAVSQIKTEEQILAFGSGFVLSRALSGIMILRLPKAKQEGMLHETKEAAAKGNVRLLTAEAVLSAACILYFGRICGGAACIAALLCTAYCMRRIMRVFGGISGDTAGYYLCLNELCMALAIGITGLFL